MMLPGLFVVGTDTGVGKTFVASTIARSWTALGHRVGVLKPLCSGVEIWDGSPWSSDAAALIDAVGGGVPLERVAPISFEAPLAPSVAARLQGRPLDRERVQREVRDALDWWRDRAEAMVVEGVGGLLCPIAEEMTVADLAVLVDYPLLVVAHRGLGTLNQTLLTVEAARSRGLRVAGVVLNGSRPTTDPLAEATNAVELARWLGSVAILGEWEHQVGGTSRLFSPEAGSWYALVKASRRID